jgi:CheY-like chemotaxis protein
MPDVDSGAVVRAMKADAALTDIPVVVFTGEPGTVPDVAACVRKGSDDPDVLLNAIAGCLKK